ncbi:MAG: hypothetical protein JNK87_42050 [Bryobacterales bacterium]|nr:hypothetical protein [Bryobacterales bacterium]
MFPGLLVKLRPTTPWRIAADTPGRERVDSLYRSDSLYSAVTLAMQELGHLEEWLAATATAPEPAVRFSCAYPYFHSTLMVVPPRNLWPLPPSPRVRWKAARYVPLHVVEMLLNDPDAKLREDEGWKVDADSECLLPASPSGKQYGPFRVSMRHTTAVDRLTGVADQSVATACLEFAPDAGLWFTAVFSSEEAHAKWAGPLKAAIRLLADSGFGGERSLGWGRSAAPVITEGNFPQMLLKTPLPLPAAAVVAPAAPVVEAAVAPVVEEPVTEVAAESVPTEESVEAAAPVEGEGEPAPEAEAAAEPVVEAAPPEPEPELVPAAPVAEPEPPAPVSVQAYWLLSLFSPAERDAVDWSRGAYAVLERAGRTGGVHGAGALKRSVRMIAEGSVLVSQGPLRGAAPDVAPDGHPHPVYRSGFALAIPIVWRGAA